MVVNDPQSLSRVKMHFIKDQSKQKFSCVNETLAEVNNNTLDRRCNDDVMIISLTISGNLSSLCSFYINGGRNIAYKQRANQSSVYSEGKISYGANLAVDGNITNNFSNGKTCTHTKEETSPSWNLTLQSNYVINRFILYNRGDSNTDRLNGFFIDTYDEKKTR
uniref:Fucolectin tachylectin-4 pentraxin-1 domain-containing protein n=1 Tax=Biomphalaria glabrata TaxID=6526 RepID=A0A2C9LX56_BIOGL